QGEFNTDGEVIRIYGTAQDVTERKQAEMALEEFNQRWRSLLNNVQLIVMELDNKGNIIYINPFFEQLTGFTSEEAIGKNFVNNFVPLRLQSSLMLADEEVLKYGIAPYSQNEILTKSGEEKIIAWKNTFFRDISDQITGSISIGEDITERYHLEKLKSEFISIVSHELRTPLTAIQASLSLLSEKIIDPTTPSGEKVIQIATAGVDRLVRLVNDILDLERLESGKIRLEKVPCDTANLINTAVGEMQEMASQNDITIETTPLSFQINADGDRLVQVLINLLSNAIKFSPNYSTVWLTVELIDQAHPQREQLKFNQSSAFILFKVRDQGRGIPLKQLDQIFERFQQVDASDSREKGGTGLGLTICNNIVEQHGGKIWAESVLGEGSIFYFTIPIQEESNLDK
ncbi:MAG TPA: ATP-binding protein, partial [Allocoleopsis sp.]